MDTKSAIITRTDFEPVIKMVMDSLTSEHSKRAYEKALSDFLAWWDAGGRAPMVKATIQAYRVELEASGAAPATVNLRMSAVRKLASEAADNGLIDQTIANGIAKVHGVKAGGVRMGNWLTRKQAQALLDTPDITTLKGLRDRAILAVQLGAGLRRSEVAGLTFEHIQQRDGRWVIADLVGKGKRVRSVPIPSWCKAAIDAWSQVAGLESGRVFRQVVKGDRLDGKSVTAQLVYRVVAQYAGALGYPVAAHDLRRTFAKLARKGGAELTQIQLTLGHSSLATTQKYVGEEQNLTDAPCDRLGLDLSGD